MSKEIIGVRIENFEKIPLKERMAFQFFLIQLILGEKNNNSNSGSGN